MAESHACCSFCRKPSSDVGPLVQGREDIYICRDCSELCLSVVDQEDERRQPASLWPPRIEEIGGWLEGIGIRAELANTLAIAARSHYERVSQGQRSAGKAILLLGPDRSSRLILACALAHSLRVPFTSTSSQRLASGRDVPANSIFYGLLQASDFDAAAAQRGVVYVEGADDGAAQDALLEVISGKQPDAMADRLELDASDLLFVCGGQIRLARRGADPEPASSEPGRHQGGVDLMRNASRTGIRVRYDCMDRSARSRIPGSDSCLSGFQTVIRVQTLPLS